MNITEIPNAEKDKMRAQLEALRRNAEYLIEYQAIVASIRRKAFQAYVREGFTEQQALELCKS